MKRRIFRMLICLLLGVVTTVGVAYIPQIATGRSMICYRPMDQGWFTDADAALLKSLGIKPLATFNPPGIGVMTVTKYVFAVREETIYLGRERTIYEYGEHPNGIFFGWLVEDRFAGWPMEALHGRRWVDPTTGDVSTQFLAIWPGFLIDTLFYGALWFGLFFGFGAAKRTLRTRRGRCPMCAYDLRGDLDAGCPECGWGRVKHRADHLSWDRTLA